LNSGLSINAKNHLRDFKEIDQMKKMLCIAVPLLFLGACSSTPKPQVMQNPETDKIIMLTEGEGTMICQPLLEKAGFIPVDAGLHQEDK